MLKKITFLLILTSALLNLSAQAQQAESVNEENHWQAKLEKISAYSGTGIPFLAWTKEEIEVETASSINYARIQGKFSEKVTQATLNGKPIIVQDDGTIDLYFGFPRESKTFTITATTEQNKTYRMMYKISSGEHEEEIDYIEPPKPSWRFSLGGGITTLSYRQQRVTPFNQLALTVKGSAIYKIIPNKVDIGLSSFYNVLALNTTSPRGYKMQYIGVNARVGYNLIGAPSSLRINLNAGLYFNYAISEIGFGNMIGPQLYPEFIYIFNNGNSLMFYGKFSPALSTSSSLDFNDNREIASGIHYSFPISRTKRLSIGVDVSQLKISVAPNWGCTNTYSLSTGISF